MPFSTRVVVHPLLGPKNPIQNQFVENYMVVQNQLVDNPMSAASSSASILCPLSWQFLRFRLLNPNPMCRLAILNPRWSRSNMWVCLQQNSPPIKLVQYIIESTLMQEQQWWWFNAAQIFYKHGGSYLLQSTFGISPKLWKHYKLNGDL